MKKSGVIAISELTSYMISQSRVIAFEEDELQFRCREGVG